MWKVKKSNCSQNVGSRERVKVGKSVRKLSQNTLFSDFLQIFYSQGQCFVQKYVVNHLWTIWTYSLEK